MTFNHDITAALESAEAWCADVRADVRQRPPLGAVMEALTAARAAPSPAGARALARELVRWVEAASALADPTGVGAMHEAVVIAASLDNAAAWADAA